MIAEHRAASVTIVQHGEKLAGPGDPGLTDRGHDQARYAAAALAPLEPVAVVSSPLRRARETAAPLAERCRLVVRVDRRVSERMNLEPGQDLAQFASAWQRTLQHRGWEPPGGRSSLATAADMLMAINDSAVASRRVVVVGHGGATIDLLRDLLGDAELEARAPGMLDHGIPGGALTSLTRSGNSTWSVDRIGSVDHLPPPVRTGHIPR